MILNPSRGVNYHDTRHGLIFALTSSSMAASGRDGKKGVGAEGEETGRRPERKGPPAGMRGRIVGSGKKRAELRGVEKARMATDPFLHKKLFEKHRSIPQALVTVRKIGNNYEILSVMPMNLLEKTQDKP